MERNEDADADELAAALANYEAAAEKAWKEQAGSAQAVIAAVRELAQSFDVSESSKNVGRSASVSAATSGPYLPTLTELMQEPTPIALYQSVVLLAVCVGGWSQASGRSVSEILDDLASNYDRPA